MTTITRSLKYTVKKTATTVTKSLTYRVRDTYGIKVSKSGADISSYDPNDFIINSRFGTIKFLTWGSGTKTVAGSSTATETITHSAGFYPLVMLYVELTPSSGRWYAAPFHHISGEDTYVSSDIAYTAVGTTTFSFKIINNTGSSKTVSYYYYVIGETGR